VTLGVTASDALEIAAETDGRRNGYEVRIVDPASGVAASEGEILVRGAGMLLGYADPADNASAFTADGFFRTGDLGRMVGDALVITGRSKDLIIRGGENISAKEIEDILSADARIVEAAAVSMPHSRLGETVCVFVVLTPAIQLGLTDISAILASAGVARQKFPEALFIVAELPKTLSGKVRKDLLRERTWRSAAEARDQA
jgi:non-ribosomal peptide synthetase component E (peptide arylation enzyme)